MSIEILRVARLDRPVLRHLYEFYMYDLSEFDPELRVNEHGTFDESVDRYWQDPNRAPYFVRVDGTLAGFVLVKRGSYLAADPDMMDMAEFFIMRGFRRQGVGRAVALQVFAMLPGRWEVRESEQNAPAIAFWRQVIGEYTEGQYEEVIVDDDRWHGPAQYFETH